MKAEAQTNKLVVINNGRCGQNSVIVREKFTDDVLQVRPKPDYLNKGAGSAEGETYPAMLNQAGKTAGYAGKET